MRLTQTEIDFMSDEALQRILTINEQLTEQGCATPNK